jgi:hypothetical protein
VIRARSFEPGRLAGSTASATYFIEKSQSFLFSASLQNLVISSTWATEGWLHMTTYNSGNRASVHLEYFDKDRNLAFFRKCKPFDLLEVIPLDSIRRTCSFPLMKISGAVDEVNYPIFARDKPHIQRYREFRCRNMDDDWNSTRMRDVIANQIVTAHSLRSHRLSTHECFYQW